MTGAERGYLLLCSHLGDPTRKCLTLPQFRRLSQRMAQSNPPGEDRDLTSRDLIGLGYGPEEALRMIDLLSQEERLDGYLRMAKKAGCNLITPFSPHYPLRLEQALGLDAPPFLWYKGDLSLLRQSHIALVGSRDIRPENHRFAQEVGFQAAAEGYVLVSGNARGADRTGQDAALQAGGGVISIVADDLSRHTPKERMLYLSEDSFDLPFSPQRALSRNRLIHAMGQATLVAQVRWKVGGTWDGSVKNLRFSWSPLYCFDDGLEGTQLLTQMGATPISLEQLSPLSQLTVAPLTLYSP